METIQGWKLYEEIWYLRLAERHTTVSYPFLVRKSDIIYQSL